MSLVFQIGMRNEGSRRWLEWKGDVVKDERSLITCRGGEKKLKIEKNPLEHGGRLQQML